MFGESYPETATELRRHRVKQLLQVIHTEEALKISARIKDHPGDTGRKKAGAVK